MRGKIVIAILGHDFMDVVVAHLTLAITREGRHIGNVELRSQCQALEAARPRIASLHDGL